MIKRIVTHWVSTGGSGGFKVNYIFVEVTVKEEPHPMVWIFLQEDEELADDLGWASIRVINKGVGPHHYFRADRFELIDVPDFWSGKGMILYSGDMKSKPMEMRAWELKTIAPLDE